MSRAATSEMFKREAQVKKERTTSRLLSTETLSKKTNLKKELKQKFTEMRQKKEKIRNFSSTEPTLPLIIIAFLILITV